ncbi:MAG: hypothetical protein D6776_10485 [Planctomycetota bacterium]|nr:MAG: hypothetical protein D6776_10485 [Planctomycetota bacterium]
MKALVLHEPHAPLAAARWLERWDARLRVLGFGLLAFTAALAHTIPGAALAALVSAALLAAGGIAPSQAFARLRWLLLFLVPIALLVPWRAGGDPTPLFAAWSWGPRRGGSALALRLGLRALGAGTAALGALAVGPFDRTAAALGGLGVPRRLVHMLLLTYRYLFLFRDQLGRVRAALGSRGFVPRAGLHTARVYGEVIGALLLRAVARTERVDQAMACRGFDGRIRVRRARRPDTTDLGKLALLLALAVLLVLFDRGVFA